ncbi:unnamed protein product [Calypogeia fissa]
MLGCERFGDRPKKKHELVDLGDDFPWLDEEADTVEARDKRCSIDLRFIGSGVGDATAVGVPATVLGTIFGIDLKYSGSGINVGAEVQASGLKLLEISLEIGSRIGVRFSGSGVGDATVVKARAYLVGQTLKTDLCFLLPSAAVEVGVEAPEVQASALFHGIGSGIDVPFSGFGANVGVGYPGGDPIVDEASALLLGLHTWLHVGNIELRFSRLSGANVDVPNPGVVMSSPVLRGLRPAIDLRFSRPGNNVEAAGISAGQDTGRYRWKCFGVCDEGRDLQQGFWQGVTCFDGDTPPFGDSDAGLKSEFGLCLEEQQKLPLLDAGWPFDGVLGELVTDSERFGEAPGFSRNFFS